MAMNLPLHLSQERLAELDDHVEAMIQLIEQLLFKEGIDPFIINLELSAILYRASVRRCPAQAIPEEIIS